MKGIRIIYTPTGPIDFPLTYINEFVPLVLQRPELLFWIVHSLLQNMLRSFIILGGFTKVY